MELKISKEEIELVLLEWVEQKFPGKFNLVEIKDRYSMVESATFSFEVEKESA